MRTYMPNLFHKSLKADLYVIVSWNSYMKPVWQQDRVVLKVVLREPPQERKTVSMQFSSASCNSVFKSYFANIVSHSCFLFSAANKCFIALKSMYLSIGVRYELDASSIWKTRVKSHFSQTSWAQENTDSISSCLLHLLLDLGFQNYYVFL